MLHVSEYKLNAPARPVKVLPKIRGIRKIILVDHHCAMGKGRSEHTIEGG